MIVSMHPERPVAVTVIEYDRARLGLQLSGGAFDEVTIMRQTPESLIALGEQITAEGHRLASKRLPQWTTEEVLQHAG